MQLHHAYWVMLFSRCRPQRWTPTGCMEQPVHLLQLSPRLVDINVLLLACSLPRLAPLLYQV